jgi:hypothetical protein
MLRVGRRGVTGPVPSASLDACEISPALREVTVPLFRLLATQSHRGTCRVLGPSCRTTRRRASTARHQPRSARCGLARRVQLDGGSRGKTSRPSWHLKVSTFTLHCPAGSVRPAHSYCPQTFFASANVQPVWSNAYPLRLFNSAGTACENRLCAIGKADASLSTCRSIYARRECLGVR